MESSVWGIIMILLKNISYTTSSNHIILDDINLDIRQGEFVVITGKSGSGKTTLGAVINGLISHNYEGTLTGEVQINGKSMDEFTLAMYISHG